MLILIVGLGRRIKVRSWELAWRQLPGTTWCGKKRKFPSNGQFKFEHMNKSTSEFNTSMGLTYSYVKFQDQLIWIPMYIEFEWMHEFSRQKFVDPFCSAAAACSGSIIINVTEPATFRRLFCQCHLKPAGIVFGSAFWGTAAAYLSSSWLDATVANLELVVYCSTIYCILW